VHFSTPKGGKVPVRSYTKPFYYDIKKCIDQGPPAIKNCLLPLASPTDGKEVIGAGGDSTEPFIQQMKMEKWPFGDYKMDIKINNIRCLLKLFFK